MGYHRTDAFDLTRRRPRRSFKRRLHLFAMDWFPVLASLALISIILAMTYELVGR